MNRRKHLIIINYSRQKSAITICLEGLIKEKENEKIRGIIEPLLQLLQNNEILFHIGQKNSYQPLT
jgi:mevalonate pyrophosphate decarboxylase